VSLRGPRWGVDFRWSTPDQGQLRPADPWTGASGLFPGVHAYSDGIQATQVGVPLRVVFSFYPGDEVTSISSIIHSSLTESHSN